ncbi:MAG TPA: sugar ABC transporter permease [Actinomycetes bacterium]|nr:sugar ABC transporter permease [Actinomycetes bacterium]
MDSGTVASADALRRGGRSRAARPRRPALQRRRGRVGVLVVLPAVLFVTVFFLVPLGLMIWMSFNNWPLFGRTRPIGLENYREVLGDQTFGQSLVFTAKYTALATPLQVVAGYGLALLVRRRLRGVGLFRTVYFLPVVLGIAATSYAFLVMLQPGTGVVDGAVKWLGLSGGNVAWLGDAKLSLPVVALLTSWKNVGVAMILFLAGMQAVPHELGEAARIDGAGWWQRELRVTLPLLRRTSALVLLLTITASILTFDQFYILTRGGPHNTTLTSVLWIYTISFIRYRLGYGAALSVALLIVLIVLCVAQLRLLRKDVEL